MHRSTPTAFAAKVESDARHASQPQRRVKSSDELKDRSVVLVAEDDADMRSLVVAALRRRGFETVEARNGSELLELMGSGLLRHFPAGPDLIISDVRMPGWSGLEVLAGLRDCDWATPVILITAFGDAQAHAEAARLGAVTMLDKPFDIEDLVAQACRVVSPTISG